MGDLWQVQNWLWVALFAAVGYQVTGSKLAVVWRCCLVVALVVWALVFAGLRGGNMAVWYLFAPLVGAVVGVVKKMVGRDV